MHATYDASGKIPRIVQSDDSVGHNTRQSDEHITIDPRGYQSLQSKSGLASLGTYDRFSRSKFGYQLASNHYKRAAAANDQILMQDNITTTTRP